MPHLLKKKGGLLILAEMIYNHKAIDFGAFKLKLHETNPTAPLSPIYFNLRKPPDGPLTNEDVIMIGEAIFDMVEGAGLEFDLIAGIPKAGEPFAKVVSRLSGKPLIFLGKKTDGDRRKIDSIVSGKYFCGQRILLIDDLITQAHTKMEAILVCEAAGLIVVGLAVLIDREQGGSSELAAAKYRLMAAFPLSQLLQYYVEIGKITAEKSDEVLAYINANK
ncbi:MAG: phosphoribosyltransferase family protein [Candidatus Pacebacteria bacterium]|nr:phosphoribosyltransferase family protein [Candidatus Paceibacterota bacterium]